MVESFFKTFKAEEGEEFESAHEVKQRVFEYIEVFFNQTRQHSTLGCMSPAAYEVALVQGHAAKSAVVR